MKKICSLSLHSFRESIHSRALIFTLFYFVFMGLAYFFLRGVDAADRVRTIQSVSFLVISLFGTLLSSVLPILSLHEEIETKKVYNILVKPISRFTFLAGKAAGILGFVFLFTFILSIISLMFIILSAEKGAGDILKSEKLISADTVEQVRSDGTHTPFTERKRFSSDSEFSLIRWSFSGIRESDLNDGKGRLRVNLFVRGTGSLFNIEFTKVYINAVQPDTGESFRLSNRTSGDENPFIIIPNNKLLDLSFPADAVSDSGSVDIELFRPGSTYYMRPEPDSLHVLAEPGMYTVNFSKAVMLLCVKFVFITAVSLCAGAFFSLPSGLAFTFFLLLMSFMLHFVKANAAPAEEQFYERLSMLFSVFVPDLTRFSLTSQLIDGLCIQWSLVAGITLLTVCTYSLGYLTAAYFGLRDREF